MNLIQCPHFLVTAVTLLLFQTVRRVGHLAYLLLTFVNLFYILVFQVEKWFSSAHDLKHLRISKLKSKYLHTHVLNYFPSLAPHERLTDLAVVPREKPHTGAAAREQPRDSPVIER